MRVLAKIVSSMVKLVLCKSKVPSLRLVFVLLAFIIANSVCAQTTIYENGNAKIVQTDGGWEVLHGTNQVAHGNGTLDLTNLPPMFQDYLEYYAKKEVVRQKRSLKKSGETGVKWGPYLTTHWNQISPYNDECPIAKSQSDNTEKRVFAGCTTISTAQVLNFFRYCKPFNIVGESSSTSEDDIKSINSPYFTSQHLNVSNNLWTFTYNYEYSYTPDFTAINADDAEKAKFIVGVAFAQNAKFGLKGTNASPTDQYKALQNHFGYTNKLYYKQISDQSQGINSLSYNSIVVDAIKQGIPVIVSGQSPTKGTGHSFVVDGYDETTKQFSINFGWGGHLDGELYMTLEDDYLKRNGADYSNDNCFLITHPNDKNSTFIQHTPKCIHIVNTTNNYEEVFEFVRTSTTDLEYKNEDDIILLPGEYKFSFEYADGTTIAPYSDSPIKLDESYYGRFVTTPATISLSKGKKLTFCHTANKSEIKIESEDFSDGILVINPPQKTEYIMGESFDDTGLEVALGYSDGTKIVITKDDYTISGFTTETIGAKTITIAYNGMSKSFLVNVSKRPEPYAVLDETEGILTFYYDNNKTSNAYIIDYGAQSTPSWYVIAEKVTKVVFDKSFERYQPNTLHDWFAGCKNLTDIENLQFLRTENVTDMSFMFFNCASLKSLNLEGFNTSNVTNMESMFYDCQSIMELDLSSFNTAKVHNMDRMFFGCNNLYSLNVRSFNTENVTSMNNMFVYCNNLICLDLSSFNTEQCENMVGMFGGWIIRPESNLDSVHADAVLIVTDDQICNANLSTIYVGEHWRSPENISTYMFFGVCPKLVGGQGTKYDYYSSQISNYVCIDGGIANPGYLTKKDYRTNEVTSIAVVSLPQTKYALGESLNLDSGLVEISYADEIDFVPLNRMLVTGFDNTRIGKQTLNIDYFGKTTTFDIEITDGYSSYATLKNKVLTFYYGSYSHGVYHVSNLFNIKEYEVNKVVFEDSFKQYSPTKGGGYWFLPKGIESITITPPARVEYFQNEELDLTGGIITVNYDDGTNETISISKAMISGYNSQIVGVQKVKVSYLEFETEFEVTVSDNSTSKNVVSISISVLPTKTEYVKGEQLDLSDGFIEIKYSDNTTETVELTKTQVSGFDSNVCSRQSIAVNYLEKTTWFDIVVNPPEIKQISISSLPTKTTYYKGDELNLDGGKITIILKDGNIEYANISDAEISGYSPNKVGRQEITVSYYGEKTTFDVVVKEKQQTPVSSIFSKKDINVWSYNHTIFIENAPDTKYTIIDTNGRVITTSKTKSTHEEVTINKSGVLIVIIGSQTFKVNN